MNVLQMRGSRAPVPLSMGALPPRLKRPGVLRCCKNRVWDPVPVADSGKSSPTGGGLGIRARDDRLGEPEPFAGFRAALAPFSARRAVFCGPHRVQGGQPEVIQLEYLPRAVDLGVRDALSPRQEVQGLVEQRLCRRQLAEHDERGAGFSHGEGRVIKGHVVAGVGCRDRPQRSRRSSAAGPAPRAAGRAD